MDFLSFSLRKVFQTNNRGNFGPDPNMGGWGWGGTLGSVVYLRLKFKLQFSNFGLWCWVSHWFRISYQWPPFSILPHFDVNNISVAQKLTKLWIFKENLSNFK